MKALVNRNIPSFTAIFLLVLLITPVGAQDTVTKANNLSVVAFEKAAQARAACDCGLLKEALEAVDKAVALLSEAVGEAANTENEVLAQRVYYVATNIVEPAIYLINEVSRYCARASLDLEGVGCFAHAGEGAVLAEQLNNEIIQAALGAGALPGLPEAEAPGEAPIPEDEYIRDHEQPPASPI